MQTITVARLVALASTLTDDDGHDIQFEIDDDYEIENDSKKTFSVEFIKNDTSLCRKFDDDTLQLDADWVILEDDFGNVHRMYPYYSITLINLLASDRSTEEAEQFLRFLDVQAINFGEPDEVNEQ